MARVGEQDLKILRRVERSQANVVCYLTFDPRYTNKYAKHSLTDEFIETELQKLNLRIVFRKATCASYHIDENVIEMPRSKYFRKLKNVGRTKNYYSTLFHEIIHWTGHSRRLKRESLKSYHIGKHNMILEELVAEIGSIKLLQYFGLCKRIPRYSYEYIRWNLDQLDESERRKYFIRACLLANKSIKYIQKRLRRK